MSEFFIEKSNHSLDRCPQCKSYGRLRRSKARTFWEKTLRRTGFWSYYRCRECGWRGAKFSIKLSRADYKTVLKYLFLMAATAMMVMFVIKKMLLK